MWESTSNHKAPQETIVSLHNSETIDLFHVLTFDQSYESRNIIVRETPHPLTVEEGPILVTSLSIPTLENLNSRTISYNTFQVLMTFQPS